MTSTASSISSEGLSENYKKLKSFFANINVMFSIRNTLAIDMMTTMPAGGINRRLQEISSITKRVYAETITSSVSNLLNTVEEQAQKSSSLTDWDHRNIQEMRRIHSHFAAVPSELYLASVQTMNEGRRVHAALSKTNNWEEAQPYVENVVKLYRDIAKHKQKTFNAETPYQALMLGYTNEISEAKIDRFYGSLLPALRDLKKHAQEKQENEPPPTQITGTYSRGEQMELNRSLLERMGFDFQRGNLLITNLAPMTAGNREDTRILVRCTNNESFMDSVTDTLYQGARGIYMQNLPQEWEMQPVGQDQGIVMLNALSLLYKTVIGGTPQFFEFLSDQAVKTFKNGDSRSLNADNLYRLNKLLSESATRNNADQLSKFFHDMLRYRIERDLINGHMGVEDIPLRWQLESQDLLDWASEDVAKEGPIQNPDWFTGRFGFIPTNSLSYMVSAQLYEAMYQQIDDLSDQIQNGDFSAIGEWLTRHVHTVGKSKTILETIENVTGKPLSTDALIAHLTRRYLSDK